MDNLVKLLEIAKKLDKARLALLLALAKFLIVEQNAGKQAEFLAETEGSMCEKGKRGQI